MQSESEEEKFLKLYTRLYKVKKTVCEMMNDRGYCCEGYFNEFK